MIVLSMENKTPIYKYKILVLDTIFKEIDPWRTEMVPEGSLIKNNKGMTIAKFISKKISLAELSGQNDRGQRVVTIDPLKRDMDVRIEILVKEIDGEYYFQDLSKVKANQSVFIPWNEGDLNHFIRSIVEVKDVSNKL